MKLNWNFLGGVGVQNKKPSVGGVWIFSGTTQCSFYPVIYLFFSGLFLFFIITAYWYDDSTNL